MPAIIDEETREIVECFLAEGREAVEELEVTLLTFEDSKGSDSSSINSMFRIFHSVKGSAGYLEFSHVERVTHQAETILQKVRDGEMQLTRKLVDVLCAVLDFLNSRLDHIEQTFTDDGDEATADALVARLKLFDDDASAAAPPPPPADPAPPPPAPAWLDEEDEAEPGNGVLDIKDDQGSPRIGELLIAMGYIDEDELQEALHDHKRPLGELLISLGAISEEDLVHALGLQEQERAEGYSLPLGALLMREGLIKPKILTEALTQQVKPLGETLVEHGLVTDDEVDAVVEAQQGTLARLATAPAVAAAPPPAAPPEPPKPAKSSGGNRKSKETLRVDVHKLNSLMDLVGELIISATSIIHNPELADLDIESFHKSALRLGRVTRSLQDVAMSVRMVPIDGTFRKMHRLVRDVSRKQGKQVDLLIAGEETEVDKKVAEIIADPLVHLMRNALDHGLETVEDRRASGKGDTGSISLEARHQGGEIWISIQDDGRGIDPARILKKARERGLPDAHRNDLSDQQIFNFIFEPGFSTADKLSDISGRGIGMDVVKRNIEQVKGRIDVASQLGTGTTFTLRIPLTLAIIEGMLVRVGDSCFTIPLLQIKESVVVTGQEIVNLSDGQEVARIRDQLIPVVRLHQFYNLTPESTELSDGILVVVEDNGMTVSLFVDELIGQRQTVVKGLSGYLGDLPGLSGCTVLGDGRISLIIDVTNLIDTCARAA